MEATLFQEKLEIRKIFELNENFFRKIIELNKAENDNKVALG